MLRKRTIAVMAGATVVMALIPWRAEADQVILDDLIVDGSLCVGFDCVNGESFGFDTIRLKENNLRIRFDDTSNSASFPNTDWQIAANQTTNGGLHAFFVDDLSNSRTPFLIEAATPSNSLYVDSSSRIGFGTNAPVADLHVKSGNTPTLRLEQDGTSGFQPQTWDVAGNETNFFIRDATNGSTLPFRIRPGAPTSAIDIDAQGDVGLGDSSPDTNLDIVDSGNVQIGLESTTSTQEWRIANNGTNSVFRISLQGNGVQEFELTGGTTGDLKLAADCIQFGNGTFHIPATAGATVTSGGCP